MKNFYLSLISAAGTFAYIILIAWFLSNASNWFGKEDGLWAPIMGLSLFVVSALLTSAMVLGRPTWLYFGGKKREALAAFFYTAGWMVVFLIAVFTFGFFGR